MPLKRFPPRQVKEECVYLCRSVSPEHSILPHLSFLCPTSPLFLICFLPLLSSPFPEHLLSPVLSLTSLVLLTSFLPLLSSSPSPEHHLLPVPPHHSLLFPYWLTSPLPEHHHLPVFSLITLSFPLTYFPLPYLSILPHLSTHSPVSLSLTHLLFPYLCPL